MSNLKKQTLQRQRNIRLFQELEELKFQTAFNKELNSKDKTYLKQLIKELEEAKSELKQSIEAVNNKRLEYEQLIQDLKTFKKEIFKFKK